MNFAQIGNKYSRTDLKEAEAILMKSQFIYFFPVSIPD